MNFPFHQAQDNFIPNVGAEFSPELGGDHDPSSSGNPGGYIAHGTSTSDCHMFLHLPLF
jgi:hypothetical protein